MNDLEANLREMRDEDLNSQLTDLIDNIDYERNKFMPKLQGLHKKFYESDGETPLEKYCLNYQTSPYYHYKEGETQKDLQGKYVLDLIPKLGKYNLLEKITYLFPQNIKENIEKNKNDKKINIPLFNKNNNIEINNLKINNANYYFFDSNLNYNIQRSKSENKGKNGLQP